MPAFKGRAEIVLMECVWWDGMCTVQAVIMLARIVLIFEPEDSLMRELLRRKYLLTQNYYSDRLKI